MKIFVNKSIHFVKIIYKLVKSPSFITLSVIGHTMVTFFAMIMFYVEKDVNPKFETMLDSLWWAFSTMTTIGYGDIVPTSALGKIIGILLMLIGVAFFSIYTALFARAILDDDVYMQ